MTNTINDLLPNALSDVVGELKNGDAAAALTTFLNAAIKALDAVESSVLLPKDGDILVFYTSTNASLKLDELPNVPVGNSIAGVAFATGQTMAYDSPTEGDEDPDDEIFHLPGNVKTDKYLAVPIIDVDQVVGIVTFFNRPEGSPSFQKDDIVLAEQFAECCEPLVRYANEVRLRAEEIEQELARRFASDGSVAGSSHWDESAQDSYAMSVRAEIAGKIKSLNDTDLELLRDIVERFAGAEDTHE